MNYGFGARESASIAKKKMKKKIPKRKVFLGKKKEYIWNPIIFDFNNNGS